MLSKIKQYLSLNGKEWLRMLVRKPLVGRFYKQWHDSLQSDRSPVIDRCPWITFEAAAWLKSRLNRSMRVFEWGSGGSTLFFAKRVREVISIEHDLEWFHQISAVLQDSSVRNVHYHLHEPVQPDGYELNPIYTSTDLRYLSMDFSAYARAIDRYEDTAFDLIFVDGRARVGCLHHAPPKLRPGGLLVLDNSERTEYDAGRKLLDVWPKLEFVGPGPYGVTFWSTIVWRKP